MDENNTQDEPTTDLAPSPGGDQNGAQIIISLEGMIKNHVSSIDRLTEEMKKHNDMLKDIFANDQTYQSHLEQAKEASRVKNATKQQILKQPQAADLTNKVKSMRSELKELKGALSDYLKEYQRLTGVNEIEGEDGQVREIVYEAKLVKRSDKFR